MYEGFDYAAGDIDGTHATGSGLSETGWNGICDIGEDCGTCSADCAGRTNGKPSRRYCCGDGTQQSSETASICDGNF